MDSFIIKHSKYQDELGRGFPSSTDASAWLTMQDFGKYAYD